MRLEAKIRTDACGNLTVHMCGGLDYESGIKFRNEILELIDDNPTSDVIIDMDTLDFVGSSGIGLFVETIKILNKKKADLKLSNVKTEFVKVFKLYNLSALDALILEFDNDDTSDLSSKFTSRKHTYQN